MFSFHGTNNKDKYKILITEDNDKLRLTIDELVRAIFKYNKVKNILINHAKNTEELIRKGIKKNYDLIINDKCLDNKYRNIKRIIRIKKILKENRNKITTILFSGNADDLREKALSTGINYITSKTDIKKFT